MKIIRSTKCYFRFASDKKKQILKDLIDNYSNTVNFFIDYFWLNSNYAKNDVTADVYSLCTENISANLKQTAAREALGIIASVRNKREYKEFTEEQLEKLTKPKLCSTSITLNANSVKLQKPNSTSFFDSWLHISNIGQEISVDCPINFHKHFRKLHNNPNFKLSKTVTISKRGYVQFTFKGNFDKSTDKDYLGVDIGINSLITTSNGKEYGTEVKQIIKKIGKCKHGSKRQKALRKYIKHYMNESVNKMFAENDLSLIVVEKLNGITNNTKKRKLNKGFRKVISNWNVMHCMSKIRRETETNRVSLRSVLAYNTSITCPVCNCTDKLNRNNKVFSCIACSYSIDADIVGAKNILFRFISGKYGKDFNNNLESNHNDLTGLQIVK